VQPALTDGPTQAAELVSLISLKVTGEDDYVRNCDIGLTSKLVSACGKGNRTMVYFSNDSSLSFGATAVRPKYSVKRKTRIFQYYKLLSNKF
jgi:hypothetical protein